MKQNEKNQHVSRGQGHAKVEKAQDYANKTFDEKGT